MTSIMGSEKKRQIMARAKMCNTAVICQHCTCHAVSEIKDTDRIIFAICKA